MSSENELKISSVMFREKKYTITLFIMKTQFYMSNKEK